MGAVLTGYLKLRAKAGMGLFVGLLLLSLRGFGQELDTLYRVHLKNGRIYTGVITENVVDDHLVMVTLKNILTFGYDSIARVEKTGSRPPLSLRNKLNELYPTPEPPPRPIVFRNRGYFGQIQYSVGFAYLGITTVHGYRFNQYLHTGLGVGFEGVLVPVSFNPKRFKDKSLNAEGLHAQGFVQVGGDVLQKRITPFYYIEMGYAYVSPEESHLDPVTRKISPHGFFLGQAFGVRVNTHRRYHTKVGLKLTCRGRQMTFRELKFDSESNLYYLEFNKIITSSWFLGLTIIQGF